MKRLTVAAVVAFGLLLLPAVALAEVSVQLDNDGKLKRVHVLTRGEGRSAVVWGQVRKYLPLELMLNPLGDNLEDGAPHIALHPVTGYPWVVWSMNINNQKRIGFATWDGRRWTSPAQVVKLRDPMGYDQFDPQISFTPLGVPILTWWVESPIARVCFSTMIDGRWSPPLVLSERGVDSRRPVHSLGEEGEELLVAYETPLGSLTSTFSTRTLLEMSSGIMDNPIPPGADPEPGDENPRDLYPPSSGGTKSGRHMLE
ncbi:MAG TPA: hypothetical protein VFG08_05280 [Candidatus Polarisedimenticolia bacterium]|nr:hypothetical protein [Candidatus Polarisedimenticolia bacterium]